MEFAAAASAVARHASPPATQSTLLHRPCDLCGAVPPGRWPTWPEVTEESGAFPYMTCAECGLVFADPLPGDIVEFHRQEYASAATEFIPDKLRKMDPAWTQQRLYSDRMQHWARQYLRRLLRRQPAPAHRRVRLLEIGCASGGMLKAARDIGLDAIGVEVSPDAARYGIEHERLDIRVGTLEQQQFGTDVFDLVVMYDLIEHVESPRQLLAEASRVLGPGGVICVHTVNVDSYSARWSQGDFFLADITGGHVTLFSPETLNRYLEAAGFQVLSTRTNGFKLVQRERERAQLGWRRPWIRLAENFGHECAKWTGQGHFVESLATKRATAAASAQLL